MDEAKGRVRSIARLIIVVAVVVVVIGFVSRAVRRFTARQFSEGEAKPTGWLATAYARTMSSLGGWLYSGFAKRLDLSSEDDVLDVACGSGAFLRLHASHVRRVAGLDHSEDLIEIANRENQERVDAGTAEFVVGDATLLPWDDGTFSVVTCNCIDCFATKKRPALEEMYRVLGPGGRILVGDDHHSDMEDIGFDDVTVDHFLWGYVTAATKQVA